MLNYVYSHWEKMEAELIYVFILMPYQVNRFNLLFLQTCFCADVNWQTLITFSFTI